MSKLQQILNALVWLWFTAAFLWFARVFHVLSKRGTNQRDPKDEAMTRPLIDTTIRTEFGDVLESAEFYDVSAADRDLTYVPGFSDMRRARDLEISAVAQGRKDKRDAKIEPLPVNCRWVRATTVRGDPDAGKQITSANLGYTAVTKKDIGQPWLTALPPGATLAADGAIRKGDTVLMVATQKQAARNAAVKAAYVRRMNAEVDKSLVRGDLHDVGARVTGSDPYIKQEKAS